MSADSSIVRVMARLVAWNMKIQRSKTDKVNSSGGIVTVFIINKMLFLTLVHYYWAFICSVDKLHAMHNCIYENAIKSREKQEIVFSRTVRNTRTHAFLCAIFIQ